jgi:hypothetical protein
MPLFYFRIFILNIYLISGFGTSIHINSLNYGDKSILSIHSPGFMQLDFLNNGKVRLGVYTVSVDNNSPAEAFPTWVFEQLEGEQWCDFSFENY